MNRVTKPETVLYFKRVVISNVTQRALYFGTTLKFSLEQRHDPISTKI